MKVVTKMEGLEGVLATLKSLPPELVSKGGGPVRFAVRKAANIIRDEAKAQMIARGNTPGATSKNYATGFTAKHIISKRTKLTQIKGERFVVTVRSAPHPNGNKIGKGRAIRTNDIAFIMEAGSAKQPAEPWLRPAFDTKRQQAATTMEVELKAAIDRIVRKLARQNKGK